MGVILYGAVLASSCSYNIFDKKINKFIIFDIKLWRKT